MATLPALGLLGLALSLAGFLALWLRARLVRRRLRARFRRAARGQVRARGWLESRGFRIEAEELVIPGELEVDGVPHPYQVRIDFLVRKGRRRFVVEVKTGERAPDPLARATRRQLAEYARLLPVDGLYLLDPEVPRLIRVRFPPTTAPRPWLLPVGLGVLLGAGSVLLLLGR